MLRFFLWKNICYFARPIFAGNQFFEKKNCRFFDRSIFGGNQKLAPFFSAENPSYIKLIWCGLMWGVLGFQNISLPSRLCPIYFLHLYICDSLTIYPSQKKALAETRCNKHKPKDVILLLILYTPFLNRSSLNLSLSSSSTTSREFLNSRFIVDEYDLKWVKKERKCHVLVEQFHGNFRSKILDCRKIESVFRM